MSKIPYVLGVPEDALLADCRGPCCTGADGAPLFFDGGGLCCPDDLLDTVMEQLDDGFLEALGIKIAAPPRQEPPAAERVLPDDAGAAGVVAMECGAEDFCRAFPMDAGSGGGLQECGDGAPAHQVGVFSPLTDAGLHGGLHAFGGDAAQLPAHDLCSLFPVDMVVPDAGSDGGGVHASGEVSGMFPVDVVLTDAGSAGGIHAFVDAAPQLTLLPSQAAPVLSASSADTTPVSLAGCQPSTTSWVFPLQLDFVVPRKKRNRPANRRTNRSWSPHFLLDAARNNNPIIISGGIGRPRPRNRQAQRVCSHCERSDTPQWRAGPDGPGTLCNACGIRHAMGKLLDEYRPSTSPSFQSDKHSNRHRKVMKLREHKAKKEAAIPGAYTSATSG